MGSKNSRNSDAFSREDPRATCSPGKFCAVELSSLPRFLVELFSEISNDVSTRFLSDGSRKTFCPVAKSGERPCIQVFSPRSNWRLVERWNIPYCSCCSLSVFTLTCKLALRAKFKFFILPRTLWKPCIISILAVRSSTLNSRWTESKYYQRLLNSSFLFTGPSFSLKLNEF